MKKLSKLKKMIPPGGQLRTISSVIAIVCAFIFLPAELNAQVIRSKEKRKSAQSEVSPAQQLDDASQRRKGIIYDPIQEYQAGDFADDRFNYLVSEEYVFDNLGVLKSTFIIPDIYFDLDQSTIRPDAQTVLDQLSLLLMAQQELCVAVTAHCDTRIAAYNKVLALRRAEASRTYLVERGVAPNRIILEIHGRSAIKNPCADNPGCSIEEQQINRRTEFNIIYNNINLAHVHAYDEQ